jgi:hypothetical protein
MSLPSDLTRPTAFAARQLLRIIGLTVFIVALQSCSAVQLAYNNLPEFTYWWADRYVDFTGLQSLQIKKDLAELQAWHRQAELPIYRDLLHQLELMAPNDATEAEVCAVEPLLRARVTALVKQSKPGLLRLAQTMSPEQTAFLAKRLARNEDDYQREWVKISHADLVDKRAQQFTDRLEKVYGNLSNVQVKWIQAQFALSTFDPALNLAEHQRRHRDLLDTLRRLQQAGSGPAQYEEAWNGWVARLLDSPVPEHRQQLQRVIQETCHVLQGVHQQTSPDQRAAAVRQLRQWQRDLQALESPG